MSDLGTQLLSYGEHLDEIAPPLTAEELAGRGQDLSLLVEPRKRPRPSLVAVLAALAVLVLVGGVALLTRLGDEGIPAEEPSVATSIPSPTTSLPLTTSPTTTPVQEASPDAFGGLAWGQVSTEAFSEPFTEVSAVAFGAGRYVMVGSVGEAGDQDAAVWVSEDGEQWTRLIDEEGTFAGEGPQVMRSVVFGGGQFVAVGEDSGPAVPGGSDLAVWVSPDGLAWTRVDDGDGVLGGPGGQSLWNAFDLTYGDAGYVTIGEERTPQAFLIAWASPDGRRWTREVLCSPAQCLQTGLETLNDGGFDDLSGLHSFAFGNGKYVAVGGSNTTPLFALILTSPDGLQWTIPSPEDLFDAPPEGTIAYSLGDVTFGDGQFVAVESVQTETERRAAVWISPDGDHWTLAYLDSDEPLMDVVTFGAAGYVAFGRHTGQDRDVAVWTSPDGREWTRAPFDADVFGGPGGRYVNGAVSGTAGFVAVGSENVTPDAPSEVLNPLIWLGTAS